MRFYRFPPERRLTVTERRIAGVPVLRLSGTLAAQNLAVMQDTLGQVRPVLTRLLHRDHTGPLIIDVSGVTSCNRAGLAILAAITNTVMKTHRRPRLVAVSPLARAAVAMNVIPADVAIYASLTAAIHAEVQNRLAIAPAEPSPRPPRPA
jgi:anti-anti-sigma regulatory factor